MQVVADTLLQSPAADRFLQSPFAAATEVGICCYNIPLQQLQNSVAGAANPGRRCYKGPPPTAWCNYWPPLAT
jgi:hypothetical protein